MHKCNNYSESNVTYNFFKAFLALIKSIFFSWFTSVQPFTTDLKNFLNRSVYILFEKNNTWENLQFLLMKEISRRRITVTSTAQLRKTSFYHKLGFWTDLDMTWMVYLPPRIFASCAYNRTHTCIFSARITMLETVFKEKHGVWDPTPELLQPHLMSTPEST